ncbi:carbohydrate-binding module family 12 protein [Trametes versicolor FP-101664 SS1]|uniref:carbohydrate-binding module family 12 protein n=1 Tax=Trametes versicolor (strain FP-101664) TaxID=717944 RepID=UPI0004622BE1|nr:carbohydrate-binding module family 12 protein [Trametes versicolor FP-101664 SS1]EIW59350.1 carbohydrate-binding module family 12 protein [Trametes versicolor FP-101664 SS1]
MVYMWEPGTWYDLGSVVEYEGHKYKIIQAHQSQSGWEPPATPALWGRLPEEEHHEHHQEGSYNPGYQQPPQQPCAPEKPHYDPMPQSQVPIHEEERKTGWDGLSDERKKQIEVGGGLLAGLGLLGAGYFAYKEHEKSDDEKKANVWALQNWVHEAEQRTRDYYERGPRGPATWILVDGKNIPTNIAIVGGEEHGQPHYICRGFHDGSLQIGKASHIFQKGGVIGYGHKEIHLPKFEVLVGDMRALRWVDTRGRVDLDRLGARPVEGGREADGTPLFIAQAHHHGAIVPGKCSVRLDGAFVPYANTEKEEKEYRVLCYA